jgi:hypothetical protein
MMIISSLHSKRFVLKLRGNIEMKKIPIEEIKARALGEIRIQKSGDIGCCVAEKLLEKHCIKTHQQLLDALEKAVDNQYAFGAVLPDTYKLCKKAIEAASFVEVEE